MKEALAALAVIALATGFGEPAIGADSSATVTAPRFAALTIDQLNVYQKPLGEQIMKVSSVGLGGPYNPLLRSPVLGQRMFDLLYYLRSAAKMRASRASGLLERIVRPNEEESRLTPPRLEPRRPIDCDEADPAAARVRASRLAAILAQVRTP